MKSTLIHIGYPKCFSTSLQRSFFEIHPEINFAGVGCASNVDYRNHEIEVLFESHLKYANIFFWEKNKEIAHNAIDKFLVNNKLNVFSSEYISLSISNQGIDFDARFRRIKELFKKSTVILIVVRNQIELIKSFYREHIRLGSFVTFSEFIEYIYKYQDRNFLLELLYFNVIEYIKKYGFKKIKILLFENIIKNPTEYINDYFSKEFGLTNCHYEIYNDNPSLSENAYFSLLQENLCHRRGLGSHHLEGFEKHRNKALFKLIGAKQTNSDIYSDVILKNKFIKKSIKNRVEKQNLYKLNAKSKYFLSELKKLFSENNRKLNIATGLEMPENYFFLDKL